MIKKSFALLLLLLCSHPVLASSWFEVEMVVFTQPSRGSEPWPEHQAPIDGRAGGSLTAARANFRPLSSGRLRFHNQISQLRNNGSQILSHQGWQMRVVGRNSAQPLRVVGGQNYTQRFSFDGQPIELAQRINTDLAVSVAPDGEAPVIESFESYGPVRELDGLVTVSLNHYLHIDLKLAYRRVGERTIQLDERTTLPAPMRSANTDQNTINQNSNNVSTLLNDGTMPISVTQTHPYLATIVMDQRRRVRSNEVHYFDHPEIGVIMQIRRM